MTETPAPSAPDRIFTLRQLGLASSRLDLMLSVLALVVLALSRFALLANGPWEQDEAIFARAVVHFEPGLHFPHPPFFPGWIGLGKRPQRRVIERDVPSFLLRQLLQKRGLPNLSRTGDQDHGELLGGSLAAVTHFAGIEHRHRPLCKINA